MVEEYLQVTVDKFIFRVKAAYLYSEAGLWVAWDASSGTARLGLTDFRQQSSGDVAFVELPPAGHEVAAGEELVSIETVKVDLAVPAPFAGKVVAINPVLEDEPERINQDPYGAGWLVELVPAAWPVIGLLDASAYLAVMTQQAQTEANR